MRCFSRFHRSIRAAAVAALPLLLAAPVAAVEPLPHRSTWPDLPPRDAEDRSPIDAEGRRLIRALWPDLPTSGPYQYFHWAPRWIEWLRHEGALPGGPPSAPRAATPAGDSFEVAVTANPQSEAESFVAIDFDDPMRVVASANDFTGPQGMYASTDGGRTWVNSLMPKGGYSFHSDPALGWDTAGNVYTATLGIKGGVVRPIVSKSTDGGLSWGAPVDVPAGNNTDKELIWVDAQRESPCRDFIYVAYDIPGIGMRFSRSVDGGATFLNPITLDRSSGIATSLASGPGGEVFVAWNGLDKTIQVAKSVDCGASFSSPAVLSPTNQSYDIGIPSFCRRRALVYPALDVDRSYGCDRGRIHVAWVDSVAGGACNASGCPSTQACTTDIYYSRSTDGGATWSERRIVHEDLPNVDQFNPWLAVDPSDGSVWIAFQDTRFDPNRTAADAFLVRSTDGGDTFSAPVRLTAASSEQSSSGSTGFQWGDYNGLAAAGGRVVAVWTDRRPGGTADGKDDIWAGVVTADPAGCLSGDFTGGGAIPLN